LADALGLAGVIHFSTGNNAGDRGQSVRIVHGDAIDRPPGLAKPNLSVYVRHRTDPIWFIDYISIQALTRCAAKPISVLRITLACRRGVGTNKLLFLLPLEIHHEQV